MYFMILSLFLLPIVSCSQQTLYVTTDHHVMSTRPVGDIIAFVEYDDSLNSTGWTMLTVWTNGSYSDADQAHAAGIGEGYATAKRILQSWVNTMAGYCQEPTYFCNQLKGYIYSNSRWMNIMIDKMAGSSNYWYQLDLLRRQIDGLYDGFNMVYPDRLSKEDFYLMNLSGDLEDLEQALGDGLKEIRARKREKVENSHMLGTGSCSALVKWVPGDLLTSQITWNSYQSMIRIIKNYVFNFKKGPEDTDATIPGKRQVFTSYPGYVSSGDDYTLLSSGLISMETTIGNSNATLWQYVKTKDSVPEFMRSVIANRLAATGKEWAYTFKQYNSGTYNNQWMIIDYNKFNPNSETLEDETLWVLEQIPGFITSADQTDVLRKQKYWPSYNTPFYPDIFKMSGCQQSVDKYGPMFAYNSTPRALIFKRDQHKVVDMASLYDLMRYNDYKNDPLSKCDKCNPPYSAENAIAARSDLNPENGTYLLPFLGHRLHGATDYKGTNAGLMKVLGFHAIAGPTAEQQPPFRWSTSDWADVAHTGMNDLQQFPEMTIVFNDFDSSAVELEF